MAATSATTFSVISTMSLGSKVSPIPQPMAFGVRFNSKNCVKNFSGLKAATSGSCESDSSFLGKESSAALRDSCTPKAQKQYQRSWKNPQPHASYKLAVLGAAGGIGQPLALLIKMSPLVSNLHLYVIANVKGVATDLSHCNTPSQVLDFTGASELANCLKGVNVVVIPAGVPRKPGMTRDDLFNINANIVKTLVKAVADNCLDAFIHIISNPVNSTVPIAVEVLKQKGEFLGNRAVADNCPDAFIHIISNPVNSTVPIATEVLRQKGVYDPKKLFGVTTLDVVRANMFVAQKKNLKLIDVDVPLVGGHAGITILPLLSKTKPSAKVVEAKAGAGSATLSMAYAAARFVESSFRALDGDNDVYECCFIKSDLTELPFFASGVKLGKKGVEAVISSDFQGLTEYEQKALEALKSELKSSIEKGIGFVQKQTVAV
ncbi:unnamed protein product [Camellia sinensis]